MPTTPSRYVLMPGDVRSRTDGDRHYVGVGQLRSLYRVPSDARVLIVARDDLPRYRHLPGDIICRPRYTGDYPLFTSTEPSDGDA